MNHASRCAFVSITALVCAMPVAATLLGLWPGSQGLLCVAVASLAVTGLLFHGLLVRQLQAQDDVAQLGRRLDDEQRARCRAELDLADTHDALCRLVRQQEQVRETERQRIARDIHDDLGQHLLALKIEVQLARHGNPGVSQDSPSPLLRLAANIDDSIAALRTVIDNLRPQALADGLQVALEHHLRELTRQSGIDCQLAAGASAAFDGLDRHLGELDVMLLRVLRESLANVVKHAQARQVRVALTRGARDLTVEVRDDGVGMADIEGAAPVRGCGLTGIADRVAAVGGSFLIDSQPGQGTVLSLSIPLSDK